MKNCYLILEIEPEASKQEIKQAYKQLALQCHPDKNGSEEQFKEISEAYQILMDDEQRKLHDAHHFSSQFNSAFDQRMNDAFPFERSGFRFRSARDVWNDFFQENDLFRNSLDSMHRDFFGSSFASSSSYGNPFDRSLFMQPSFPSFVNDFDSNRNRSAMLLQQNNQNNNQITTRSQSQQHQQENGDIIEESEELEEHPNTAVHIKTRVIKRNGRIISKQTFKETKSKRSLGNIRIQ